MESGPTIATSTEPVAEQGVLYMIYGAIYSFNNYL